MFATAPKRQVQSANAVGDVDVVVVAVAVVVGEIVEGAIAAEGQGFCDAVRGEFAFGCRSCERRREKNWFLRKKKEKKKKKKKKRK